MTIRTLVTLVLPGLLSVPAGAGVISGRVTDGSGQPVTGVMILVSDHETGIPVRADTGKPFTAGGPALDKLLWTLTDDDGQFRFDNAPDGTYRLLGQSWEDATKPITGPLEKKNGRIIRVHGSAANVVVPSEAAQRISLRPLGTATLDLVTDPKAGNSSTLMVVSRAAMPADPVLAFTAWSGPFMPGMLCGNLMPLGRTTVHGLPAGTVHIGAFAPDNNPGFGGVSVTLTAGQTTVASVKMLATWSDGHHEPPPELRPLIAPVRKLGGHSGVQELVGKQHPEFRAAVERVRQQRMFLADYLSPFLERTVEIEGHGTVRLKDLMAATAYSEMMRHFENRATQRRQAELKRMGIDRSVTYEQAAIDLHRHLGSRYPAFAIKQIDWDAVGRRLLPRAKTVKSDAEFGLWCLELVAALEDSHAQVSPAAAQLPPVAFPAWDAGFACLVDDRGKPVVYSLTPGGPAEAGGLRIGTTVETVNGQPAEEAIGAMKNRLTQYVGYSSSRYLRYHAFRFFARQMERGDPVVLQVSDADGSRHEVALKASLQAGYLPRLPVPSAGIADSGEVSWKMLDGNVGYIYVRRIRDKLIPSLDRAVQELADARGLIIDVRGNSGGGFNSRTAHLNFQPHSATDTARPRFTGPMAVLIDARCISAGEGWTSWFIANERARLFGETTAGASARKEEYILSNGLFKARFPVKAYKGFLDRPIERRGLEPDVQVMQTVDDLVGGRDTVLEAAREYLMYASRAD